MAKRGKTRGGSTPPQPVTSRRVIEGWQGPEGGRIRLAQTGEADAVQALMAAAGARLDQPAADQFGGELAVALCAGLTGQEAWIRAMTPLLVQRTYLDAIPGLSLVLVAEDKAGDVVGAAYSMPPMPIMNGAQQQGFPPEQLMSIPLALAKLAGLSVTEKARGAGWATHLLKRTVQVYEQLDLLLFYGQFPVDSGLDRFYQRRGFTPLAPQEKLDLEPLSLPFGIDPGPGEQLFVRWKR
ncbi:hypothetical protein ACFWR9_24920 [Streptomyces sp. NPDC058534]|uniref:hypothetical protein n=1 Tax=Streptomyces sp. NPDC058534 TaxID=3346541 RepID=UPI0036599639